MSFASEIKECVANLPAFIEKRGETGALYAVYGAMREGISIPIPTDLGVFNEQVSAAMKIHPNIDIYGKWAVSSLIWLNMYGWKKAKGQSDAVNAAGVNPMYLDYEYLLTMPGAFNHSEHIIDALKADHLIQSVDLAVLKQLEIVCELSKTRVVIIRQGVIDRIKAHNALVSEGKPGLIADHVKGKDSMVLSTRLIELPSGLSKADKDLLNSLPELIKRAQDLKIDVCIHLQWSLITDEIDGCVSPYCCFDYINGNKKASTVDKLNVFRTKDKVHILVIMRKNAQGIWCWALPGGFVDHKDFTDALALLKAKGRAVTKESLDAATTSLAAKRELEEEVGLDDSNSAPIDPRVVENPEKFFQLDNITFELVGELLITKVRPFWEARLMFLFKEMTVGVNISFYSEAA